MPRLRRSDSGAPSLKDSLKRNSTEYHLCFFNSRKMVNPQDPGYTTPRTQSESDYHKETNQQTNTMKHISTQLFDIRELETSCIPNSCWCVQGCGVSGCGVSTYQFQNPSPISASGVKPHTFSFRGSINYNVQTPHPQTPHP